MDPALGRVWIAAAALSAGAVVGAGSDTAVSFALVGIGATVLTLRRSAVAVVGIALVAFGCGWLASATRLGTETAIESLARDVPRCTLDGTIQEAGGLGTLVGVRRAACEGHAPVHGAGVVVVDGFAGDPGSLLGGRGWLVPLGEGPFDRARERAGAGALFDAADIEVERPSGGPAAVAARVRNGLRASTATLGDNRGGLIRGLTIGDTSSIDPQVIESFRRSGLSHLLAVSGSNVAIVVGTVVLGVRRLPHAARLGCTIASLALFVLVVGPDPSVLRAAVMGGIAVVALAWGRRARPLNTLGLAVIAVVGIRPGMVFSAGLHLSVAATAGIVLWGRSLAACLTFLPRWVALPLGATVAAQAAVAPVSIATFGQVSIVGPVANALAIPAVAPATIAGFAAASLGTAFPAAGRVVAALAALPGDWILRVAETLGEPSWASVEVPRIGAAVAGSALGTLALATLRRSRAPR